MTLQPYNEVDLPVIRPRMRMVYIAGPYIGDGSAYRITGNIETARQVALWCAIHHIGFFSPHLHTGLFNFLLPTTSEDWYRNLDYEFLYNCDALLLLPGWETSMGSMLERDLALELGLPIYYWDSEHHARDRERLRAFMRNPMPTPRIQATNQLLLPERTASVADAVD